MLKHRTKYNDEFKKSAIELSYVSPKPVHIITEDLGIAENLL